jgi:hypothetical protein
MQALDQSEEPPHPAYGRTAKPLQDFGLQSNEYMNYGCANFDTIKANLRQDALVS